jgi:hypothetical protein
MSDDLLHAMSVSATLGTDQLTRIFDQVYRPNLRSAGEEFRAQTGVKTYIMRLFQALGYCEFDYEHRRVHMCPPSLVLLPTFGTRRALLTGARSPALIRRLRMAVQREAKQARFSQEPQERASVSMPTCVTVEAVDKETLSAIGSEAGIDTALDEPAAWKLAVLSSSLNDVVTDLGFENRAEPNWPRRVFREDRLTFSKGSVGQENIWLAEYTSPIDKSHRHWLWRGHTTAEVDRDWGRYVVLSERDQSVIFYDDWSRDLAVPFTTPLPMLLARAAALSSGTTPETRIYRGPSTGAVPPGHPVLVYKDVPQVIAKVIASRLAQELVAVDAARAFRRSE